MKTRFLGEAVSHTRLISFVFIWIWALNSILFAAFATADGRGFTSPSPIIIRNAVPLKAFTSRDIMWKEYGKAIDESDFDRMFTLFSKCAASGDPYCRYFLAQGIFERLTGRIDMPPPNKKFSAKKARDHLRAAFGSPETALLVSGLWRVFYQDGYMGFPRDEQLANCWSTHSMSSSPRMDNNKRLEKKRIARFCNRLERTKYPNGNWLSN
jgi:hypothetical protein